jgi:hypothetical protein
MNSLRSRLEATRPAARPTAQGGADPRPRSRSVRRRARHVTAAARASRALAEGGGGPSVPAAAPLGVFAVTRVSSAVEGYCLPNHRHTLADEGPRAEAGGDWGDSSGTSAYANNAFALLDGAGEDEDEWETVAKKKAPKKQAAPAKPAAAPAAPAAKKPLPPGGPTGVDFGLSIAARIAASTGASTSRPYAGTVITAGPREPQPSAAARPAAAAPGPAAQFSSQRTRTHHADGTPVSDDYYRTFQKVSLPSSASHALSAAACVCGSTLRRADGGPLQVYRTPEGDVRLRFHKTDIVQVRAARAQALTGPRPVGGTTEQPRLVGVHSLT